jgi:hypothetical protein
MVIYVPFSISQDNIIYNKEEFGVISKSFDEYTLLPVFLYGKNQTNVFIEFKNQYAEIQRSVRFTSELVYNERIYNFEVSKLPHNFSLEAYNINSICLIDKYYINIASFFSIDYDYEGMNVSAQGEPNRNYDLIESTNSYFFKYKSPATVSDKSAEPTVFILINVFATALLVNLVFQVYPLLKDRSVEKIPIYEKMAILVLSPLIILSILACIRYKLNIAYIILIPTFGVSSLIIYVIARSKAILLFVNSIKEKKKAKDY